MSTNFIINPTQISFDEIRTALETYVASKPADESWQDFYVSGAGQTIIEIAAALGAFYAYHFIAGRRESFLSVAQNYSSLVGIAENLGYSTSRGDNLQMSINIVPNQTVTLSKWTIIGNYTEYDLVLTEDIILNQGVATNIPVIIGNLMEEVINVTTNQLTQFSFSNPNVTDTFRLLLNGQELPTSTNIADALNDRYVTLTNSFGSMDVFYLQQGQYLYKSGDSLSLQFIERNSLDRSSFSNSNLTIDYASQINESTVIENRTDVESIDSIKIKAPIYHETSMVIRARKDYSKYLQLAHPQIIQANDMDIYPGLIAITYIKNDGTNLSEEEKQDWLDQIEESRPSGVAKAIIQDSVVVNKTLNISLWRAADSNISSTVSDTIDEILSSYENVFEVDLDLNQIEHDIEDLDGIKIARVELASSNWKASTTYDLYDQITVDDDTFYVSGFIYKTGQSEPTWPSEIGETVVDGDIIWELVDEYQQITIDTWEANTAKERFDYIKVQDDDIRIFMVKDYVNKSGSSTPSWGETYVYDNKLVWEQVSGVTTEATWEANTIYHIGDIITTGTYLYKVINYRGVSGTSTPTWTDVENGTVTDNNLIWTLLDSGSTGMTLGWNEYLKLDKVITIVG